MPVAAIVPIWLTGAYQHDWYRGAGTTAVCVWHGPSCAHQCDLYGTALAHMSAGWDLYDLYDMARIAHMLAGWDLYGTALAHHLIVTANRRSRSLSLSLDRHLSDTCIHCWYRGCCCCCLRVPMLACFCFWVSSGIGAHAFMPVP